MGTIIECIKVSATLTPHLVRFKSKNPAAPDFFHTHALLLRCVKAQKMSPLTSCDPLNLKLESEIGSLSLFVPLPLLFLYSPSEAPLRSCACSECAARSSVLGDFYVYSVMESAKHLSAENFPASYELNSPLVFYS